MSPAHDAYFCQAIGTFAGVSATGRDMGVTLGSQVADTAAETSREAADLDREIIVYAYTHPDFTPIEVSEIWERGCLIRLGQPTPAGAAIRRARQGFWEDVARRGLLPLVHLPPTGGAR
jgi:hypothetical protein